MLRSFLCLLLALAVSPAATANVEVFAAASPSVVVVLMEDGRGEIISLGSGVVVDEGVAVTNCHVVYEKQDDKTEKLRENLRIRQAADAQTEAPNLMNAEVVGTDKENDLCLLSIAGLKKPSAQPAVMSSVSSLLIGEDVYAIGAPQGLDLSFSRGIVSQLRIRKGNVPEIQTDASISPGSSGGGLFNANGELVGITTYQYRLSQNLNFAMPTDNVVDLILNSKRGSSRFTQRHGCLQAPQYQCAIDLALYFTQRIAEHRQGEILCAIAEAQIHMNIREAKRTIRYVRDKCEESARQKIYAAEQEKTAPGTAAQKAFVFAGEEQYAFYNSSAFDRATERMRAGDISGAKQILQSVRDIYARWNALRDIISAQIEAGDINGAKQTALEIDNTRQPHLLALLDIAVAQATLGNISDAKQIISDVLRTVQKDGHSWSMVVLAQLEIGDIKGAKETLKYVDTEWERHKLLLAFIRKHVAVGDIKGAKQVVMYTNNAHYKVNALFAFATAQAEAGHFVGAMQTAQSIPSIIHKAKAFASIAKSIAIQ